MLMIASSAVGIEENRFGPVIGILVVVGLYPKDPALLSGPAPVRGDVNRLACPEDITAVNRGGQVEIHGYRGSHKGMAIHGEFPGQGPVSGIQNIQAGLAVAAAIRSITGSLIIIRAGTENDKPLAPYADGSRIGRGEAQVIVAERPEQPRGDFRIGDIQCKKAGPENEIVRAVRGGITVAVGGGIHADLLAAEPHPADQDSPPAFWMVGIYGEYSCIKYPGLQVDIVDMGVKT